MLKFRKMRSSSGCRVDARRWLLLILLPTMIPAGTGSETGADPQRSGCPPQESIPGCSCNDAGPSVFCEEMDPEMFNQTIQGLKGRILLKLELRGVNASSFDVLLFRGVSVQVLVLERLEVADDSFRKGLRHFQGLERSLRTLEIRRFGPQPFNLKLDHLKNLMMLIIEESPVPSLDDDWFTAGPAKLSNLYVQRDSLNHLGENAFVALNQLMHLSLANNELRLILRSMLPSRSDNRLSTLDLSNNRLDSLSTDFFEEMPDLIVLNLRGNAFHTLSESLWKPGLPQLKEVRIEDNPIMCDTEVLWICAQWSSVVSADCAMGLRGGTTLPPSTTLRDFCRA